MPSKVSRAGGILVGMSTGRPQLLGVDRPPCPRGHESRTLLDGHYRSPEGNDEGPRYRCVSLETGETLHRFTPTLRRRRAIGPDSHEDCVTCERPLGRNDGHITGRRFHYAVRDIAEMLVRVGHGELYRHIAKDIRRAGRSTHAVPRPHPAG
jgi:hypothetical protein